MKVVYKNLFILFAWLCLGLVSLILINFNHPEPYKISTIYLGVFIIFHGLLYFNIHGGDYITPTGLYLLFSSLLIGFPAIYVHFRESYDATTLGHYQAALICYLLQVFVYFIFLSRTKHIENNIRLIVKKSLKARKWLMTYAIFIMISGFIISNFIGYLNFFQPQSVYVGIIMLTISMVFLSEKVSIKHLSIAILLFLGYYYFVFENFGRINLVTLLLIVIIIINLRFNFKRLKLFISIMFYPAIVLGSYLRSGDFFDLSSGVGSITAPFYRFGQLIDLYQSGFFSLKYGETIFAAFVVFIPRDIWIDKPWNFNREITYIFRPELVKYGHSEAAVVYAEMIFNFGFLGIILALLIFGVFLNKLDNIYGNLISKVYWRKKDIIKFIFLLIVMTGMLNLIWGGFSTFINRDGFRIAVLIFFVIIYNFIPKKERPLKNYNVRERY